MDSRWPSKGLNLNKPEKSIKDHWEIILWGFFVLLHAPQHYSKSSQGPGRGTVVEPHVWGLLLWRTYVISLVEACFLAPGNWCHMEMGLGASRSLDFTPIPSRRASNKDVHI